MNEQSTKSEVERPKPFNDLLQRLVASLRNIDSKTKAFQIDYPRTAEKDVEIGSEFSQELEKSVKLAEYIDSKLSF